MRVSNRILLTLVCAAFAPLALAQEPGSTATTNFSVSYQAPPNEALGLTQDTEVTIGNSSNLRNVIARVTVWSKAQKAVLDFNTALHPWDVITFRMSELLKGNLNLNTAVQATDFCVSPSWYQFLNPDATDRSTTTGHYQTPAFSGAFRQMVWDSIDATPDAVPTGTDGIYASPFEGFITVDVVNFCTNTFQNQNSFYGNDGIATTPAADTNVLHASSRQLTLSGGTLVSALPNDAKVYQFDPSLTLSSGALTYYRSLVGPIADDGANPAVPAAYRFGGDGRRLQLLADTGFEHGSTSWVSTPGVVELSAAEPSHTGSYLAWLDGYGFTHTDSLSQTVTIPAAAANATLSFWLHIDTAETAAWPFDTLAVQIRNTADVVLANLASYSNANHNIGYALKSFDVTSFRGQTVKVVFVGTEDFSNKTSFVIDDAALNVR